MMNFETVNEYLKQVEATGGIRLGLENTRRILADLSLEFKSTIFVQVAGTNGKGSTSCFISSIFREMGWRVGLFTSPHLEDVRERIILDGQWIPGADFADCLWRVKKRAEYLLQQGEIEGMPTYFEYTFLTALCYFSRENASAVVLEVGMGGRLDATTTITPDVTVITTIGRDHMNWLGKRLSDIAREKAGIIKPHVPVVCGCKPGSVAFREIKAVAGGLSSLFVPVWAGDSHLEVQPGAGEYVCAYTTAPSSLNLAGRYDFKLRVNGRHQAMNAAVAIKVVEVIQKLRPAFHIAVQAVEQGLYRMMIPGRIEIFNQTPEVILDASHNEDSIAALVDFLEEKQKRDLTLIFGVLADKRYRGMIKRLLPYTRHAILSLPLSVRALAPEKMVKYFTVGQETVQVCHQPTEAWEIARQLNRPVLVTGSFYLVGAIRPLLYSNPIPGGNHG